MSDREKAIKIINNLYSTIVRMKDYDDRVKAGMPKSMFTTLKNKLYDPCRPSKKSLFKIIDKLKQKYNIKSAEL